MSKMLHNEARELLVQAYEKTHNADEVAKMYGVSKYTVYHLYERKRATGSVELLTHQRGRKCLLSNIDRLEFLDESGININMTRRYGRSIGKARVIDDVPLDTPKTTTVLSSMRLNGKMAYTTYDGGTTGVRFVSYIKDILLPTLTKGDIIVMDNMRSHHVKAVAEVIEAADMNLLYLPSYSPDMNPDRDALV